MIPSVFIIVDNFPLNANGKVDRKRLPAPSFSTSSSNDNTNSPFTRLEQQLQDIFSQVFHVESTSVEASFNQLGGTSLDMIHALTLIRGEICKEAGFGALLTNPSIRQRAQVIEPLLVFEKL
ncbi:unnamed protein product [Adineta steineri]|uniref:Carrier domain-containing protein n=1 Tax=Adineta steineri TaxID=433720 RepID=A0A814M1B6_9BILA|nr:unnamed protein product [Adineta steineri]CAF3904914.1 unnamed protein product [Adineta steineri]CAF4193025.1 unnamed protein product [Adineta steineri]